MIKKVIMKKLILLSLIGCLLSCSSDDTNIDEQLLGACNNDEFHFTIEAGGITFSSDSCIISYYENTSNHFDDSPASISWTYPGFPEWNNANDLAFLYKGEMRPGEIYEVYGITAIMDLDNSSGTLEGEMIQRLGNEVMRLHVDEFNLQEGFMCGTFEGKAEFTNYEVVDVEGSFKGYLMPQ